MKDRQGSARKFIKKKDKNPFGTTRKRFCRLCVDKVKSIDYKDTKRLEAFMKERGKIVSTRGSGNCAKHQRMLTEAIKKARFVSLVAYVR
ncbi:MAG: 30S ribosomal protein S18 [Candidatus Omnitrophica bacterium]|nr:30S ribosomal protein S18 [Candidatus Omnitrophota bacterium]